MEPTMESASRAGAGVARTADDLTPAWFTTALRRAGVLADGGCVETVVTTPIGTGQMSVVLHASVTYSGGAEGPPSFVVKLAAEDGPGRATGHGMGFYLGEVRFYRDIAPTVGIRVPTCHLADIDTGEGWFTLLMADDPAAAVGNMIEVGTVAQAEAVLTELVGLQAPRWDDPVLCATDWLQPTSWIAFAQTFPDSLAPFLSRFGDRLTPEEIALCEKAMPHAVGWLRSWSAPTVLQHGDFRPDNILFARGSGRPSVFDWQTVRVGPPLVDAGYFVGGSLSIADRRAAEKDLIRGYHERLCAGGVRDYTWNDCWTDYRRYALYGVYGFVGTSPHVQPSERGDQLYLEAFRRYAAQAIDLEADGFLP
jgi:hypothetical protein